MSPCSGRSTHPGCSCSSLGQGACGKWPDVSAWSWRLPSLPTGNPDLSSEPQTPCIASPPPAPVVVCTLQAAPPFPALGLQAPLRQPRKPSVPRADPSPLHSCTFDVGDREALQLLRAEARLVVPRAVGLLGVLELAVTSLRVGVVEAAVDGWEDGHLSGGSEPATEPLGSVPGSPRVGLQRSLCRISLQDTAHCPPREENCSQSCPRGPSAPSG